MKSSCIENPAKENLVIVREWQVDFCNGNQCAAALLSFFIYWHDIKLEMKGRNTRENEMMERHGERTDKLNTSLHQFHSEKDLEEGIMNIWKKDTIRKGLDELVESGILEITKNPNPKYAFDKTRYFLLHPEVANEYLERRKNNIPKTENLSRSLENPSPSPKNQGTITETTSETIDREDIIFSLIDLNSLETDASVREAWDKSEQSLKDAGHLKFTPSAKYKEHSFPFITVNLPGKKPIHVVSDSTIGILSHERLSELISPLIAFQSREQFSGYFRKLDDRRLDLGLAISKELGMGETRQPTEEEKERFNL